MNFTLLDSPIKLSGSRSTLSNLGVSRYSETEDTEKFSVLLLGLVSCGSASCESTNLQLCSTMLTTRCFARETDRFAIARLTFLKNGQALRCLPGAGVVPAQLLAKNLLIGALSLRLRRNFLQAQFSSPCGFSQQRIRITQAPI
jgi:hypothetical protein